MNRMQVHQLLLSNPLAVERALLALYRQSDETGGFTPHDTETGTYYARWVLSGRHLPAEHLSIARFLTLRYVAQLARASLNRSHIPKAEHKVTILCRSQNDMCDKLRLQDCFQVL